MSKKPHILIVYDDRAVCSAVSLLLKRSGFSSKSIYRPQEVLPYLEEEAVDLVILDMNFMVATTGKQGLDLLRKIKALRTDLPVILMTGWATVQLAVEGMKLGASDFMAKPWDNKELLKSVRTILELQNSQKAELPTEKALNFNHIIGQHPRLLEVLAIAKRVAKTDAPVLIVGESGTGKELIAEAIHYESQRNERPFVKVNLGGISSTLFESELFGHKKGAFTDAVSDRQGRFQLADTGSIFLDEIGELALESQVKLLRVLQEKTFEPLGSSQTLRTDVRVLSATNKKLEEMISEGTFREDLFYRINLIKIEVPPLRERRDDIPLLVDFFLGHLRTAHDRPDLQVSPAAYQWLKQQHFSGNIRQLKNLVERTVLISASDQLEEADFARHYLEKGQKQELPAVGSLSLEELEKRMVIKAMEFHDQKVSQAAKSLGITRSAMYRRLQKYNIPYDQSS
ncbi:MAG: sigma-54 dependent transcriptional regulator [Bacteroidota bacterium]